MSGGRLPKNFLKSDWVNGGNESKMGFSILIKKRKILAIPLIVLIVTVGMLAVNNSLPQNGVRIKVNVEAKLADFLATEVSGYEIYAQVMANDPLNPNSTAEVFRGFIGNRQIHLNPSKNRAFRNVLDHWIERLGDEKWFKDFKTCLIVSIWFISDGDDYMVVPDKGVNYNPFNAKRSLVEASITVKAGELVRVNETETLSLMKGRGRGLKSLGSYFTVYRWVVNPEYSVISNEFVKTPVMVLENPSSSSTISGSLILSHYYTSRFRVTLAYGFNIQGTPTPSLDIYSTDLFSASDKFEFGDICEVNPTNRQAWIYIMAKPVILFEEMYKELWYRDSTGVYYLVSVTPTGYQRITAKISDVDTYIRNNVKIIRGGAETGFPGNDFNYWFFQKVTIEQPPITNTVLKANGGDESKILLQEIVNAYTGGESVELGVGVPVGAYLAFAIAPVSPFLAAVVSGLSVSLGYAYQNTYRIGGVIRNSGPYDVAFKVAVSDYLYDFGGGSYLRIPSGIYFKLEPV